MRNLIIDIVFLLIYMSDLLYMYFHMTHVTPGFFCPAQWPSKTFFEIVKSPYWFDIRHWKSIFVRRKCCHSTKSLILYHFALCTWCYCTTHFRRLYIYIWILNQTVLESDLWADKLSTGFELIPLITWNTNRLALCPAP